MVITAIFYRDRKLKIVGCELNYNGVTHFTADIRPEVGSLDVIISRSTILDGETYDPNGAQLLAGSLNTCVSLGIYSKKEHTENIEPKALGLYTVFEFKNIIP